MSIWLFINLIMNILHTSLDLVLMEESTQLLCLFSANPVWLCAGNTRWNLKGHTAPPDAIRFDNRGHKFLTFDSEGRDR